MTSAEMLYLKWLKGAYPRIYSGVLQELPPGASGLSGLGSFLDDLTGALNTVTTTVSTVSSDKALISYNLQRAQQGLPPATSLPATGTMPQPSLLSNKWLWAGLGVVVLGVGALLLGGKKKKARA